MSVAHRIAIRALVERAERRRSPGDHVRDAGAATPHGRREAQCFLVGFLPDRVGKDNATAMASFDLAPVEGRLREFLGRCL